MSHEQRRVRPRSSSVPPAGNPQARTSGRAQRARRSSFGVEAGSHFSFVFHSSSLFLFKNAFQSSIAQSSIFKSVHLSLLPKNTGHGPQGSLEGRAHRFRSPYCIITQHPRACLEHFLITTAIAQVTLHLQDYCPHLLFPVVPLVRAQSLFNCDIK